MIPYTNEEISNKIDSITQELAELRKKVDEMQKEQSRFTSIKTVHLPELEKMMKGVL